MKSLRLPAIVAHLRKQRFGRGTFQVTRKAYLYGSASMLGLLLSFGAARADEAAAPRQVTHWVVLHTTDRNATLKFAADTALVDARGNVIATKNQPWQETITVEGKFTPESLRRCSTGWCMSVSGPGTCTLGLQLSQESSAHVIGSDLHLLLTEPDECCATCVRSQEFVLSFEGWELRSITTSEPRGVCECEATLVRQLPLLLIREGS